MRGLAKSRSTQARTMARVKRTQYARRADLRMTSLLAKLQAWQAHVAAQLARAIPKRSKSTEKPDKEHYRHISVELLTKISYHNRLSSSRGARQRFRRPDDAQARLLLYHKGDL